MARIPINQLLLNGLPGFQASASPTQADPAWKYGMLQVEGALRQQWISDPTTQSSVNPCTVTLDNLPRALWDLTRSHDPLWNDHFVEGVLEPLSALFGNQNVETWLFEKIDLEYNEMDGHGQVKDSCHWHGRIGLGVVFLDDIARASNFGGPQISELTQAIYTDSYPIDTLKHVFVIDIANRVTRTLIETQIYTQENGLSWPDQTLRVWDYGSPEYQALLGTPLGKCVAALVLGAFVRGTRRIARIACWEVCACAQLRVDIELVV